MTERQLGRVLGDVGRWVRGDRRGGWITRGPGHVPGRYGSGGRLRLRFSLLPATTGAGRTLGLRGRGGFRGRVGLRGRVGCSRGGCGRGGCGRGGLGAASRSARRFDRGGVPRGIRGGRSSLRRIDGRRVSGRYNGRCGVRRRGLGDRLRPDGLDRVLRRGGRLRRSGRPSGRPSTTAGGLTGCGTAGVCRLVGRGVCVLRLVIEHRVSLFGCLGGHPNSCAVTAYRPC